jgi:hypothetical protein
MMDYIHSDLICNVPADLKNNIPDRKSVNESSPPPVPNEKTRGKGLEACFELGKSEPHSP